MGCRQSAGSLSKTCELTVRQQRLSSRQAQCNAELQGTCPCAVLAYTCVHLCPHVVKVSAQPCYGSSETFSSDVLIDIAALYSAFTPCRGRKACKHWLDVWFHCRLRDWLDQVLWEKASHKQDIYRMKGLLNVADKHEAHILQAVHELYDIVPGMCWSDLPETQWHQTKVVVIGRNLQYDMLHEGFMACFLPEPSQ